MCSVLIGAVINIGLDPVFIFVLHMGVSGAALATILSRLWCCMGSSVSYLKNQVSAFSSHHETGFFHLGSVMALGISPFIMSATEVPSQSS